MEHSFSIRESLSWGWHTLKSCSALMYQVFFTLVGVQIAYAIVQKVLAGTFLGILGVIVLLIVSIIVGAGSTLIMLRIAQGKETSYRDIWPSAQLVLHYIAANILVVLIVLPVVAVGLLLTAGVAWAVSTVSTAVAIVASAILLTLTVCAALYFALRYLFVKFAVLDGAGITGSLRVSAALSAGEKWHLLLFLIVLLALNIVGAIVFVVGLLVSIPVSMLAFAHAYVQLKK